MCSKRHKYYKERLWLAFSSSDYKFRALSMITKSTLGTDASEKHAKSSGSVTSDLFKKVFCFIS